MDVYYLNNIDANTVPSNKIVANKSTIPKPKAKQKLKLKPKVSMHKKKIAQINNAPIKDDISLQNIY